MKKCILTSLSFALLTACFAANAVKIYAPTEQTAGTAPIVSNNPAAQAGSISGTGRYQTKWRSGRPRWHDRQRSQWLKAQNNRKYRNRTTSYNR